jgi:transposase
MMRWKGSPGIGKALTGPWAKLPWRKNAPDPTRRIGEKKGRKRSVLTDGRGVPLSIVGSAANVNDVTLLVPTLDSLVMARPKPTPAHPQNLCADAGYKGQPAMEAVLARHYTPHVKQRREEAQAKRTQPGFRARRWVVERTHSWINRFRKLLVSFEKTEFSYTGLLCLAAAMICWRKTIIIYG